MNVLGWGWGDSAAPRGRSLQREVVNISWDLPAPPDSSDPVTFQNMGLENSLHLMAGKSEELSSRLLKGSEAHAGKFCKSRDEGPFSQIIRKLNDL